MFKVAVGHSLAPDPLHAAQEIRQLVAATFEPYPPCACVLFCGHPQPFAERLIAELYGYFPDLQLTGCSSYAEASSQLGCYAEHSCTAMFLCSDTVHIDTALVPGVAGVPYSDLQGMVRTALEPLLSTRPADQTPKLCLVFTELMHVNQNALVQALQTELGEDVIVLGGAAGHATIIDLENPTCQYYHRQCHHNSAAIMVFSGPLGSRLAFAWTVGIRYTSAGWRLKCNP
ncbi:MAG: FIST N-terminal domain-containing protein [Candidatus Competibacteraceae bacterium]